MKKVITILLTVTVLLYGSSCNRHNDLPRKTFVLVHGAWQGAWVWQDVKTDLERAGQEVLVVELPAHGDDTTSPAAVTIDAYRDKVIAVINSVKGKVELVGHSMGGVVVTATAEKIPSRIDKLIYIGAFLPASGQSLLDLAGTDAQSHLGANLRPSKDGLLLDVVRDSLTYIFCQDGSPAVKQKVLDKYRPEPAIPFTNPVTLTAANFGHVDKYYIHTLQDHAIGLDLQSRMVHAAGITKEYALNSGHSPFLSMPDSVAGVLLSIVK